MNIQPVVRTIKDLLVSGKQFVIPRFQREYSWDKEHYREFFEDILDNLVLDDKGNVGVSQYFLGTMLFVGDFTSRLVGAEVVDGQQRLTTITILFSALADCFKELEDTVLKDAVFKYIMMQDDDGMDKKVLVTKTNYPYFAYFIQDKEKSHLDETSSVTDEEHCIQKTYEYFRKQLCEKSLKQYFHSRKRDEFAGINYKDLLKAIRDQVLACVVISIATESHDQANRLFEILNAKGKSLSDIDLIKNKLFEVLNEQEPCDVAFEQWKDMRDILQKNAKNSVSVADYYRHFWITRYGKSTRHSLYDEFKKLRQEEYRTLMADMVKNARYYAKICNPAIEDYDNKLEYRYLVQSLRTFNDFSVVQVRIPLLALYNAKELNMLPKGYFKKAVLAMENFHFVYTALFHLRANKLEKVYATFARDLRVARTKDEVRNVIDTLISELVYLYPKEAEFIDVFTTLNYSNTDEKNHNMVVRYIVRKINCYFAKREIFADDGTIEHIIPESFEGNTTNIGNLILLEQTLNTLAANRSYTEKASEVYCQSNYSWVAQFVQKHETWDASQIEQRAKVLAELYYKKILGR